MLQKWAIRYFWPTILPGETPPAPMVAFLAQQISIDPGGRIAV